MLVFILWSSVLSAQEEPKISYQFKNITLPQALEYLEQTYHLTFAFDQMLLAPLMVEEAKTTGASLSAALSQLLIPLGLAFEVVGGKHVLIRKGKKEETLGLAPLSPPLPTVCGQLKDSLSGFPLPAANVWLKGSNKGTYTDNNGRFTLQGPFRKDDSLAFSYVGYQGLVLPLASLLQQPCASLHLAPLRFGFDQVLIKDKAITFLAAGERGDGLYMDTDQLGIIPGWGERDVLRMAQLLPGVNTTDESAANLHIRGGTPDQNLILWDGIPVYHTGHFFGMFSAFNSSIVEGVDIYRGDFSARYGGRVSGVLDIKSKPIQKDSLEAGIGLNLLSANAFVKVPLLSGRSAFLIAGRRSLSDLFQSQIYQNLFNQVAGRGRIKEEFEPAQQRDKNLQLAPRFYFSDVNLKWVVANKTGGEGTISFYKGEDVLDYDVLYDNSSFYLNALYQINLSNWGLSAQWNQQWNERWQSHLMLVSTQFQTTFDQTTALDTMGYASRFFQSNRIQEQRLEWNNAYRINANQQINMGYQGVFNEVAINWIADVPLYDTYGEDNRYFEGTTHTFYLDYDYTIPEHLHLDWGLRYSIFANGFTGSWEPRFSLAYHVLPHWELKTSIGRYSQVVNQIVIDNDLGIGERFWIMADSQQSIPAVTSAQFAFGLRWKQKGWLLDVDVYRKWISGLVSLSLNFDGDWENPYSGGSARIIGLDILLKKSWPHYDSWLSYTLGVTQYQFDRINGNNAFPTPHDRLHNFKWTHQIELGQWAFSFAWLFGSGLPYTQATGGRFVRNETSGEYDTKLSYAGVNANRLPVYHRLDWSGAYHFKGKKKVKGKLGWSIFNVLDRLNVYSRTYFLNAVDDNVEQPQLVAYDRSLLGFTPNLFLELSW